MKKWNPKLNQGDRVVLYYMGDGHEIPPLTKGTVDYVQENPFGDKNSTIYYVEWDIGISMSLLESVDCWIKESANHTD